MIVFLKTSGCPGCDAVQDVLDELGIAHKVVPVPHGGVPSEFVAGAGKPPVLVDDDKVIHGIQNIIAHLEELKELKELWYKYQSDVCYCD